MSANVAGLFFLDTNIFVYAFDKSVPDKRQVANQLIQEALKTRRGVISTQIVQEFLNVGLKKFSQPMSIVDARDYLQRVLVPLCHHFPSITFYERALLLKERTGFSWYDGLVVAAAIELGCQTIFSEDLQNGRIIQGLTISNPFAR